MWDIAGKEITHSNEGRCYLLNSKQVTLKIAQTGNKERKKTVEIFQEEGKS